MSTNQREIIERPLVAPANYRPLLSAKDLALLLGFSGKKPESGVYEMVKDGRIPENCIVRRSARHFMFHTDRVMKKIDEGGFHK
jgi:type VI protein secretion system component VasF